jgi:arylsulfatase A-like enzyme
MDDFKAVRQRLKTAQPGPWELYDLKADPHERYDLSTRHPERIARAEAILRDQVDHNPVFPVPIPGLMPKLPKTSKTP